MKKVVIIFSLLVILITISACSSKLSNPKELEEKSLLASTNVEGSIIESKLNIICNNPKVAASSNPYDYTKDNQDYRDIVNLGDNALKYMLTKFNNSKENGLREYVMAIACSEILKENPETKKWTTGREWYDNYTKANK